MPSARLQQQFIRLWQCCEGKSQDTTLNELAALLSCSRRHMRTLLNTMQDRGWLTWEAEVGRGKRSRLTFLYTGLALQQQRAEDLLEQDRIDQLVQLVGDKATVRQMLVSHLGRSFRQGRHILRVLYYRPLRNLLPGSALRRSETHIARQIFSSLTRINEENGELEADIAHHWQQISPLHWRFFCVQESIFIMVVNWKWRRDRLFKTNQYAAALFAYCGHCVADALDAGYPSHATGPLVTVTAGTSSGDDPAARMGNPQ